MKRLFAGAIALAASACLCGSADAVLRVDPSAALRALHGGNASIGGRVASPFAAIVFCKKHPSQCAQSGARGISTLGGRIVLDEAVLATLSSVNASVNRSIAPANDSGGPNADTWSVGGRSGDCEDFALAKRAALIRHGFPSSAALVATAESRQGVGHAVLLVRTDRGDFVLDNKADRVVPFSAGLYRWQSIQSPDDPRIWRRL